MPEELFANGLAAIPHGRPAALYAQLLNGSLELPEDDVADAMVLDIELNVELPPHGLPPVPSFEEESDDGDGFDLTAALEGMIEAEDAEGACAAAVGHDGSGSDTAVDGGGDGLNGGDAVDALAVALAAPAGPAKSPHERMHEMLEFRRWGIFTLTLKDKAGPYGSLQGACPWHRKNHCTGCKKLIRIEGPAANDMLQTLRLVLWWCSQARNFDRQWKHVYLADLRQAACPPLELLETWVMNEPPAGVLSDVQLDEAEAAAAAG